jgi:hypothetical protein
VNDEALVTVAQVGMHAHYQQVAVLANVLLALEAMRGCY